MISSASLHNEELNNLKLDRPGKGKTPAQIQKHTLTQTIESNPVEKSLHLLSKGDDLQKISVIENVPTLLSSYNQATLIKIIPKIQQELINSSCEIHITTSAVFRQLIEKKVPVNILQSVLLGIENKDPVISNTWMETLIQAIPFLTNDAIRTKLLPMALLNSQITKPLLTRLSSCRLLGQMAASSQISSNEIRTDILPYVQSLCQDHQFEVRAVMCSQIPSVAKGVSNKDLVNLFLVPCVLELCSDENMSVRCSAVEVLVALCPNLSDAILQGTIIPVFKQMCTKSADEHNTTYPVISKNLEVVLKHMERLLSESDCVWFLQYYKSLTVRGFHKRVDQDPALGVLCREYCALSLPAMAQFTLKRAPLQNNIEMWHMILQDLTGDPCYIVRRAVASTLVKSMTIMGTHSGNFQDSVIKLLKDDAEEVLDALVPNIGFILMIFQSQGLIAKDSINRVSLEVCRALLKCEMELFNVLNWRNQQLFIKQIECLPYCVPSDFIHLHFTPMLFNIAIEGRVRPVRVQATRTLLVFLRLNGKEQQRKWIRDNLFNKLCLSNSCYTRCIYIKMCAHALTIFSNRYFKEHFYKNLLHLADDPVSNIRLQLIELAPILKDILTLPGDKFLLTNLDLAITKMGSSKSDRDRDVLYSIDCTLKKMRTLSPPKQDMIVEDKRRLEEEEKIFSGKPFTDQRFAPILAQKPAVVRPTPHK
ncbi:unnamed protein product [Brassicogethes aeneus]|uniref:Serine/threonine-protein phosphatase 4 regulatory subunit 4 n=1 Tax=Brassicogethes aeneus TaxID=1431903 RepID=A0A9P0APT6_BRAAE|nr:unnamed protein product [Brassicogethes aeneus]